MLISPLLPTGYISPTEHAFWFPRNRPFLHCKTKKFKSLEKIRIGKNYEIHIAKKLPFLNEKSILPNILPFSKIFCQKLGKHLPYFLSSIWQPCALLAVSRFGFRVSWLSALVLVALWTCHWSPRHFADLALVFFVISHANKLAGLMMMMGLWREIDFPAKQNAIRFGCVALAVSWCWYVDACSQNHRKLCKQCVAGWFLLWLHSQTLELDSLLVSPMEWSYLKTRTVCSISPCFPNGFEAPILNVLRSTLGLYAD